MNLCKSKIKDLENKFNNTNKWLINNTNKVKYKQSWEQNLTFLSVNHKFWVILRRLKKVNSLFMYIFIEIYYFKFFKSKIFGFNISNVYLVYAGKQSMILD